MILTLLKKKDFVLKWGLLFLFWLPFNKPTPVFSFTQATDYSKYGFFDYLTFRAGDSENTLVEIYGQFPTRYFKFVESVDGYIAHYELSTRLLNQENELIEWAHQVDTVRVGCKDEILKLTSQLTRISFVVPPGKYRTELFLIDLETHAPLTFVMDIVAPDYGFSGLKVSDLQLSAYITSTEDRSVLVKNNWSIMPNVSRLFGMGFKTLFIYTELYNLSYELAEANQEFIATFIIRDPKGKAVLSVKLNREIPGETFVLVAKIPVQELKSGEYELTLNVKEVASGQVVEKSTYFNVVNPI